MRDGSERHTLNTDGLSDDDVHDEYHRRRNELQSRGLKLKNYDIVPRKLNRAIYPNGWQDARPPSMTFARGERGLEEPGM